MKTLTGRPHGDVSMTLAMEAHGPARERARARTRKTRTDDRDQEVAAPLLLGHQMSKVERSLFGRWRRQCGELRVIARHGRGSIRWSRIWYDRMARG